jgi:hypothetical protein
LDSVSPAAPPDAAWHIDNLFSLLLLLHLFDFLALSLNFLLLLLQLSLRLLALHLLILHRISNHVAAGSAYTTPDCSSRCRMTHSRADYRPCSGSEQCADASPFFALAQRLSRASGH